MDDEERALKAQEDRDMDRAILESEKERDFIQVKCGVCCANVLSVKACSGWVCMKYLG
jgi:hypothetical protein